MSIQAYFETVSENFKQLLDSQETIAKIAEELIKSLSNGNKIMFCGNGGSAADSQHLAAELMGRYLVDRDPLPAIALTTDTSAMTAIGNDYSFSEIFSRQVKGIGNAGDVLVGISTSGNSENILRAFETAEKLNITTIGLTGGTGGKFTDFCDITLCVPSRATNHIQEMHIATGHVICGIVESRLCLSK